MNTTNIVSLGFAPNGEEMFQWNEGDVTYTETWVTVPGGGYVMAQAQ